METRGTLDDLRMFSESYFENRCCDKNGSILPNTTRFTNFSIREILKPNFGGRFSDYEDSARSSMSPSSDEDVYPSEEHPVHNGHNNNHGNILLQRFLEQARLMCHEEDSSSYSSSSDCESALDLRIRRKRTPPKQRFSEVPAWVFCTRYSDRPSAGPRARRRKHTKNANEKRPRTAFNTSQLEQLQVEFEKCAYLSEERRQNLAEKLNLNESQVKIWFQNRRAKVKKSTEPNLLARQLMAEGLYNHKPKVDSCHGDTDDVSDVDV